MIAEYITKMKNIQALIIEFIENEELCEENYQNLISKITEFKISESKQELESLLYLLLHISNNHYRTSGFFDKIFRIFAFIKHQIKSFFTNFQIFNIFNSNKKILLFLLKEKIIVLDRSMVSIITKKQNNEKTYFFPEIKSFLDQKDYNFISPKISEDFELKRENEVNDNPIYNIIKNDFIDEFITYVNKNDLPLSSNIEPSVFETNNFILQKTEYHQTMSLIEYATFFGSIQIFKYLCLNDVYFNQSLWIYAIHGQNPEIIHYLEENLNDPLEDESFIKTLILEAIKCHHNYIKNYLQTNYILCLQNDDEDLNSFKQSLKYYNMAYIQNNLINKSYFCDFCEYNYYIFVKHFLENTNIEINEIHSLIFKLHLKKYCFNKVKSKNILIKFHI